MRYRIVWSPDAFRRLLREWNAAGSPQSGILAFDEIENLLTSDAQNQGESRERDRRVLLKPPLGVLFEVRRDSREAVILDAWLFPVREE